MSGLLKWGYHGRREVMKRQIYLDHAATTPVDPRVLEAMLPYFSEKFGNASGVYAISQASQGALEEAREKVAGILGCSPDEVIFTGGATEADNAAIAGAALGQRESGDHIVTSAIEHHAVLHACESLDDFGFETTYLGSRRVRDGRGGTGGGGGNGKNKHRIDHAGEQRGGDDRAN